MNFIGFFFCCYSQRSEQISIVDDLAFAMYQDPEIAGIIKNLDRKKQEYVYGKSNILIEFFKKNSFSLLGEKFDEARKFKQAIQELLKVFRITNHDL